MSYPSASKLVIAARAAGYHELLVGRAKAIFQSLCPNCEMKRVIRFRKVERGAKGPKLIDSCYGCDYKSPVKKPGEVIKAAAA